MFSLSISFFSLGLLHLRSIIEIDRLARSCSHGGKRFMAELPKGVRLVYHASGYLSPKGGVVTGRCFSRRVIEGLDWRFLFKDAFH